MATRFLTIQGYRSCNVILHPKLGGLGLCNKSDCPLYRRRKLHPCKRCDYRVKFHISRDRTVVKIALSMAGLFFTEYIKYRSGNNYSTFEDQQIDKVRGLKERIDFGTRVLIYKILLGIQLKYQKGMASVDTMLDGDFTNRLGYLAMHFLNVRRSRIKHKPRIYEK